MTENTLGDIAFPRKRSIVWRRTGVCLVLAASLWWCLVYLGYGQELSPPGQRFSGTVMVLAFGFAVAGICDLAFRTSRLILDAEGLWVRPEELYRLRFQIPWSAICACELRLDRRQYEQDWIDLRLDPEAWEPSDWVDNPATMSLSITNLEGSPQEIFDAVFHRWQLASRDECESKEVNG